MSEKIAIVRATDHIPFDGIVKTVSSSISLSKEKGSMFSFEMESMLRELNGGEISQEEFEKKYLPYVSKYNSMSLWALNSLVPDDPDNKNVFSNKDCAIIDDLEEQINNGSEFISLAPTDTAIKGDVALSGKSTILISKERFSTLSDEEKEKLSKFNVKVFDGDLKEAVSHALTEKGYNAENLSLEGKYLRDSSSKGFIESPTSQETLDSIYEISNNHRNINGTTL